MQEPYHAYSNDQVKEFLRKIPQFNHRMFE